MSKVFRTSSGGQANGGRSDSNALLQEILRLTAAVKELNERTQAAAPETTINTADFFRVAAAQRETYEAPAIVLTDRQAEAQKEAAAEISRRETRSEAIRQLVEQMYVPSPPIMLASPDKKIGQK